MSLQQTLRDEMPARVHRAREIAGERGFDGLLVVGQGPDRNGDLLYLCGHVPMLAGHPSRFCVRGRGLGMLFIPTDYRKPTQLAVTTPFFVAGHGVDHTVVNPNLVAAATEILAPLGKTRRIGIVGLDVISAMTFMELVQANPDVRFIEADDIIMNMRACKSPAEIKALRIGSAMADEVGDLVRGQIRPGVTEKEIGNFIIAEMTKRGADNGFATCQSGVVRSGEPFMFPAASDRVMEDGDLVHMEINGRYCGYKIDICRATVVGKPHEGAVHLLETCNKMLEDSIAAIRPGVLCEELEIIASDIAEAAGFRGKFAFGFDGPGTYLGHGIGLGVDEPPVVAKDELTWLKPGMVLTIEPGLYRTEWGGARIEDEVLVTPDGVDVMTKLERRWWA